MKHQKAEQIKAPVQYGHNFKSLASYLHTYHLIPEDRIAQIMDECFDLPMSVATIKDFEKACATNVSQVVDKLEELSLKDSTKRFNK